MPETADVVALPRPLFTRVTRLPHKWPAAHEHKRIPKTETQSGHEQIERSCAACRLVKITVMRGDGARAYRWGDGCQFEDDVDPECPGGAAVKSETAA